MFQNDNYIQQIQLQRITDFQELWLKDSVYRVQSLAYLKSQCYVDIALGSRKKYKRVAMKYLPNFIMGAIKPDQFFCIKGISKIN